MLQRTRAKRPVKRWCWIELGQMACGDEVVRLEKPLVYSSGGALLASHEVDYIPQ